jgi:hypothetical protein
MRRLTPKADRLVLQGARIESLENRGYGKEVYNDLFILTQQEDRCFLVEIFKGTAAHPILNSRYREASYGLKTIEQYKSSNDRIAAYKKERKANKTLSTAANAAAAIRGELKEAFPGIKFSVTSSNYSMGNSVRIDWEDGPTTEMVRDITDKYQQGRFDGMTDMYEYSNDRDDIPQAKYVQVSRFMSEATRAAVEAGVSEAYATDADHEKSQLVYRIFSAHYLPAGAVVKGIKRTLIGHLRGVECVMCCLEMIGGVRD